MSCVSRTRMLSSRILADSRALRPSATVSSLSYAYEHTRALYPLVNFNTAGHRVPDTKLSLPLSLRSLRPVTLKSWYQISWQLSLPPRVTNAAFRCLETMSLTP
eukprot:GHUV01036193.1.p1 GENE.GHUV01036193.1~~GHUV01036193.1.p1  ORF type:complete len:104 (-),score=11.28 GHUV01036193.1:460-771(-)